MATTVTPASVYRFATASASCLVNSGDRVAAGQRLCSQGIYSSISGKVNFIGLLPGLNPSALETLTIEIVPDGANHKTSIEPLSNSPTPAAIIARIHELGITGMGGGGFPTYKKLQDAKNQNVHTLVINALECEPAVKVDTDLLACAEKEISSGAQLAARAVGAATVVLATKPGCSYPNSKNITHRTVSAGYPQGEERRLLEALFGLQIGKQQTPTERGYLVLNTATCYAIDQAICQGTPVLRRLVSINGTSHWVHIGHPVGELSANPACGGQLTAWSAHPDAGLTATTYAICNKPALQSQGCIRCGRCQETCPEPLLPDELLWQIKAQDWPTLNPLHLNSCIECGACDQVCPSQLPILANIRYAKSQLARLAEVTADANRATEMTQAHEARLQRHHLAREVRRQARLRIT